MKNNKIIEDAYATAKQRYAELKVDTDNCLTRLRSIPISIHCRQGDDVGGFEKSQSIGGLIKKTGVKWLEILAMWR